MAKKVLLVSLLPQFDIDKLISVVVLAKLLAKQDQNKITIYPGRDGMPLGLEKVVSPQGVTFLENLTGDYTSITLNKKGSVIKNVRWEESGEKIKILVYTEQGLLDTKDYAVDPGKAHYEKVYAIGFSTQQAIENVLDGQAGVWKAAETVNIDKNPINTKFAQQNHIYIDATSYAELVTKFALEHNIAINSTEASELLSAIYWKTQAFKNEYTTPGAFATVNQLTNLGANPETAAKAIFSIDNEYLESERQIYQSAHQTGEYLFATISEELRNRLRKNLQTNPDRNPLTWIKGVKASFIISPSENTTTVYASSNDNNVKLPKIFSRYKFRGSNLQGSFRLPVPVAQAETEILNILKSLSPASEPKPLTPQQPKTLVVSQPKPIEPVAAKEVPSEDPLKPAAEEFPLLSAAPAAGQEAIPGLADPLPKSKVNPV